MEAGFLTFVLVFVSRDFSNNRCDSQIYFYGGQHCQFCRTTKTAKITKVILLISTSP